MERIMEISNPALKNYIVNGLQVKSMGEHNILLNSDIPLPTSVFSYGGMNNQPFYFLGYSGEEQFPSCGEIIIGGISFKLLWPGIFPLEVKSNLQYVQVVYIYNQIENIFSMQSDITELIGKVNEVNGSFLDISRKVESCAREDLAKKVEYHAVEMNRLYHNEFSDRLKKMEMEIEAYRKKEKSLVDDGEQILTEIATLYSRNTDMFNIESSEKLNKRMDYLFEEMKSILERYDVEMLKSANGDLA
jgi:hypothetical protein